VSAVVVIPAFSEETSLAEIEVLVQVRADRGETRRRESRTWPHGEEIASLKACLDNAERADDREGES
jgi:hypothetical protein